MLLGLSSQSIGHRRTLPYTHRRCLHYCQCACSSIWNGDTLFKRRRSQTSRDHCEIRKNDGGDTREETQTTSQPKPETLSGLSTLINTVQYRPSLLHDNIHLSFQTKMSGRNSALFFVRGQATAVIGTAIALLVTVSAITMAKKKKKKEKRKQAPLPPLLPLGFFKTIQGITSLKLHEFLLENLKLVSGKNVYRINLPFPCTVAIVGDADDARKILTDQTTKKAPVYSTFNVCSFGEDNIVTSNGRQWHHRRKAMNPAFAPKQIKRMNEQLVQVSDTWISETLVPLVQKGKSFDIYSEMIKVSVAAITKAAFEYDMSENETNDFMREVGMAIEEFGIKAMFNPFRKYATWILPERQRAFQSVQWLRALAFKIMESYRNNEKPTPDTVLDLIMKNSSYRDDAERAADVFMMLFAGHETTGCSLAWILYHLAKHPREQEKLREELLSSWSSSSSGLTMNVGENKQLMAVVKEGMRLSPAVFHAGLKALGRDFITTKRGFLIPKNSFVILSAGIMFHDPSVYEDPKTFNPSRWLKDVAENDDDKSGPRNKGNKLQRSLIPFSLGPRNCIGQPLANAELHLVISRLIQQFNFTVEQEGQAETRSTTQPRNFYLKATSVTVGWPERVRGKPNTTLKKV